MNTSSHSPPEVSGGVLEAMAKDLWERFAPSHGQSWEEETHKAEYRHAALSALEVSGVVEALEPFADCYGGFDYGEPDDAAMGLAIHSVTGRELTVGDFRRAASIFTQGEQS